MRARRAVSRTSGRYVRGTADHRRSPPHAGELVFGFVLEGSATLEYREGMHEFVAGDAFVIPPG